MITVILNFLLRAVWAEKETFLGEISLNCFLNGGYDDDDVLEYL